MNDMHSDILARRALQIQRGAARAAVLGVNDGLVSILCLVLGVAAAGASGSSVLLAGFAGVIAGAVSMSAGEWISVKAQVELFGGVIKDIHRLMKTSRPVMVEQIAHNLIAAGQNKLTAHEAAREIAADDVHFLRVYARQIMGFNSDELGSPWVAAVSSFLLFTLGALAPMAPWFFTNGTTAIILSICFTAIGSLIVGGYVAASSGKRIIYGALRQLAIIALASAVTYGIGYLFGASMS
jgi:VIT1/CCC1 family predicted Fe2+/Mn2+ transporter